MNTTWQSVLFQPLNACPDVWGAATCFFSTVNNYILLTDFAPWGAGHIRAKLFSRVHVACSNWYKCHKSATGPSFFQPPHFIGVLPSIGIYAKFYGLFTHTPLPTAIRLGGHKAQQLQSMPRGYKQTGSRQQARRNWRCGRFRQPDSGG